MNPEAISLLIESNRYNIIEIIPQLENYVQYQIDKQTYHFESNLTVLKFYQFHPEKTQKFVIAKILIKALMNLPSTDFSLCMYLIPEKLHHEEPIRSLITLSNLLEPAQFENFWVEANTCKEFLDTIPGFYESIRGFIITVVTSTYRSISKTALGDLLTIRGTDLDALINARGWKQMEETVTFSTSSEDTSAKAKKLAEHAKMDDLGRILSALQPALK